MGKELVSLRSKFKIKPNIRISVLCVLCVVSFILYGGPDTLLAQDAQDYRGRVIREIRLVVKPDPSMPPGTAISEKKRARILQMLRANMKSRAGQPYSIATIDRDIRRIERHGRLRVRLRVVPVPDGVRLEMEVIIRPVVKKILFLDEHGADRGASEELLFELTTQSGNPSSKYFLMHDEHVIEEYYRARGFPFVKVTGKAEYRADGVTVKFIVRKGHYILVQSIEFEGNKFFTSEELYDRMQTRVQTFLRNTFLGLNATYVRATLEEDVKTLLTACRDEGFLDARVSLKSVKFKGERAYITVSVDEGQRYYVESVTIEGNTVFTTETLKKKFRIKPGSPYRKELVNRDVDAISEIYERSAHIHARIWAAKAYPLKGNRVNLTYNIFEGPQIFLGKVKIDGNYRTRDRVIRRELSVYPGEKFDIRELKSSFQKLLNLQFFQGIETALEDTDEPDRKTLVLKVTERKTGMLQFGFSYSDALGLQGMFQFAQRNFDLTDLPKSVGDFFSGTAFVGGGTSLNLVLRPGRNHSNYNLLYRDPHLMDTNTRFSLNLERYESQWLRQDERGEGIHLGLGRSLTREITADLLYRFQTKTLTNISPSAPTDVFLSQGTKNISAIKPEFTFNFTRLDIHRVRYSGCFFQASYEYAGAFLGGEVDFWATSMALGVYEEVYQDSEGYKHVLSLTLKGDWKKPHHRTQLIPWYERYFLGGPGTIRGFQSRGAGPKEGRDFIGGCVSAVASLEYSFPLSFPNKEFFRGVLFLDAGNLSSEAKSFLMRDFRASCGFGFRIRAGNSFVFVFEFGYPLIIFKGDSRRTLHFSMSTEF